MKTTHRIRRDRKQPQPGTLGAPFRGTFDIRIEINTSNQEGVIRAIKQNPETLDITTIEAWNAGQIIDQGVIRLKQGTNSINVTVGAVLPDKTGIPFSYSSISPPDVAFIPAGNASMIGSNGSMCGGAYVTYDNP
jgi:hypothetical protein